MIHTKVRDILFAPPGIQHSCFVMLCQLLNVVSVYKLKQVERLLDPIRINGSYVTAVVNGSMPVVVVFVRLIIRRFARIICG